MHDLNFFQERVPESLCKLNHTRQGRWGLNRAWLFCWNIHQQKRFSRFQEMPNCLRCVAREGKDTRVKKWKNLISILKTISRNGRIISTFHDSLQSKLWRCFRMAVFASTSTQRRFYTLSNVRFSSKNQWYSAWRSSKSEISYPSRIPFLLLQSSTLTIVVITCLFRWIHLHIW